MQIAHDVAKLAGRILRPIRAGTSKLASAGEVGSIFVSSEAFPADGTIPDRFARPPAPTPSLSWSGVPDGTREIAVLCEDPDAPLPKPFVHWMVYGLAPTLSSIAEGAIQANVGLNSAGTTGFAEVKPPPGHGLHHYHFQVFALNATTDLPARADREALLKAMDGHILDWGEVIGTYEAA